MNKPIDNSIKMVHTMTRRWIGNGKRKQNVGKLGQFKGTNTIEHGLESSSFHKVLGSSLLKIVYQNDTHCFVPRSGELWTQKLNFYYHGARYESSSFNKALGSSLIKDCLSK